MKTKYKTEATRHSPTRILCSYFCRRSVFVDRLEPWHPAPQCNRCCKPSNKRPVLFLRDGINPAIQPTNCMLTNACS